MLNLGRQYKVSFFDMVGNGPFTVRPLKDFVQDSVNFSIDYNVTNQSFNSAKFIFYNLQNSSIELFSSNNNRRGFSVDLWYGDAGNTQSSTIFKGLTFNTNTYRSGTDLITEVTGCDLFLNLLYKNIAQSFPSGTSTLSIVNYILQYYGDAISLGAQSQQFLNKIYQTPKLFRGSILDIFKIIASDSGLFFNLHKNILNFSPNQISLNRNAVISQVITPQNGLIGNIKPEALSVQLFPVSYFGGPALDKNISILTVNTLIRQYYLYDTVELRSSQFNGLYGILSLSQRGEWRQNNWYSTLKLVPAVNS